MSISRAWKSSPVGQAHRKLPMQNYDLMFHPLYRTHLFLPVAVDLGICFGQSHTQRLSPMARLRLTDEPGEMDL